jgi:hypothetical protein
MNKYLYLYSAGNPPQSEEAGKAQMAAWMAYFGKLGNAIVDGGAPLTPGARLLGKAQASNATGYSVIQAESLAEAVALTVGHPHLANAGGIEVFEFMKMPGM